jgi:3-hydroxybutyryl-CoA dehydrogenase
MARNFDTVGVVGLGTMGAGIVEVLARNGISVIGVEIDDAALERGRGHLEKSTSRAVARGKLDAADADALHARVTFTTKLADLSAADLVIEAVPERFDLKRETLRRLDEVCRNDAVLATNTSSLSVTELAATTRHPGRVIGVHFFNPAPVMRLVEIVSTVVTAPGVVDDVKALVGRLGKTGVGIGDKAGFIANALLFGYLNHAVSYYENGYASRDDIDAAMKLGCGLPMGPFALLDLIGVDTAYEICDTMYRQSRDRLHAPAPLLRQMCVAGLLGRKTGRGFYTYEAPHSAKVVADDQPGGNTTYESALDVAVTEMVASSRVNAIVLIGTSRIAEELAISARTAGYTTTRVMPQDIVFGDADGGARAALAGAGLVLVTDLGNEATTEDAVTLFAKLGELVTPGTVLASALRTVPVVDLAAASQRPAEVIGLVPARSSTAVPEVVELVGAITTSGEALATARAVGDRLGLHVVAAPDRAGRIIDALLFPYLNDAVRMLDAGYATADDIDAAMTLGCGYPRGPFAMLDEIGLDVALEAQRAIFEEFREPGFAPAPLLTHLVTAGRLGRATGSGFREHPAD